MVLTLKNIVTTFWATLWPFLGTSKLSDLDHFFTGALATAKAFTISNLMSLPPQEVGEPPQKYPEMAVFGGFFGALHKSHPRRALGVAPLNSPCFFT